MINLLEKDSSNYKMMKNSEKNKKNYPKENNLLNLVKIIKITISKLNILKKNKMKNKIVD